ncbi:hypothetical protein AMS68_002090 [Peltaster fructicola]|uniref:Uncharacterized protein n=1 Tax=Peltaster fructicola TaxID=286661 RepID=A0A6H0XPC9_9PEZI|nr:hypothetical protein AMS68_002090 [Peltaster fructicola]
MESPSPSKYPHRDGLPLSTLSPQRVNGRVAKPSTTSAFSLSSPIRKRYDDETAAATFFSPGLQQSPSFPEFTAIRERFLPPTDVSGLVKRFEYLDVRDRDAESQERKRKYDEAIDRAKIAREEAEDEAKRCREELRSQRKEYEDCKDRERRACKRIDVLMDEFTRAKEQWSSQLGVYEKEVRRARKEAFKSSSSVLKLQEENKHTANELRATKTKLDLAQRKAIASEEEKFAAQYQLVAVQEELEKLQATLRIAQEEREALKKSLREDDIARIAAEGMIALPPHEDEEVVAPSKKLQDTEVLRAKDLEKDLQMERRRRKGALDLIEFMRLECSFGCCSCATTSAHRHRSPRARSKEASRRSSAQEHSTPTASPLARTSPQSLEQQEEEEEPVEELQTNDERQAVASFEDREELLDESRPEDVVMCESTTLVHTNHTEGQQTPETERTHELLTH